MPLNPAALTSSPGLPGAGGRDYPATRELCAHEWAEAMRVYAAAITPPSSSVAAAAAALEAALVSAFATTSAAAPLESAFAAFALSVGGGMVGFLPTPPPAPVGFAALLTMSNPAPTRSAAVANIAATIDAWMHTGVATNLVGVYPWL
jgi:hypothetical protein